MFITYRWKSIVLVLLICSAAEGAFELDGSDFVGFSLAGAGVGSRWSYISGSNNPAVISGAEAVKLSYRNVYGLKELRFIALSIKSMLPSLPFSLNVYNFGNDKYRESWASLNFSGRISRTLTLGIKISGYCIFIKNFSPANLFSMGAGGMWAPLDNFSVGVSVCNVAMFSPTETAQDYLATNYSTGIAYNPSTDITIFVDVYQEEDFNPEIRVGTQLKIQDNLTLRTGFSDNPSIFSGGFDLTFSHYRMGYAFQNHPQLGFDHQAGIAILFYPK